jgi:hypothetical protein
MKISVHLLKSLWTNFYLGHLRKYFGKPADPHGLILILVGKVGPVWPIGFELVDLQWQYI